MNLNPGDHVVDYVDDALHDVLPPPITRYVLDHAAACPICSVALDEARKRHAALASLPPREASETLIRSTLQKVQRQADARDRRRRAFWRFAVPAMAACLLILAALHLHYYKLSPSGYDLRLLGQRELLADTDGSIRTQLVYQGQPVQNAAISLDLENPRTRQLLHLADYSTDAQGTGAPRFHLPDWPDGAYTLRVTARSGSNTETITDNITLKRSWQLMLSTDKPVYQPGQLIHLRSLGLRRPDLKPVAGQNVVFSITDPAGNVIFKQTGVTSRFGIASADCPTAPEIAEGPYTIACRVGDTESHATVEIKRYVLPKFKVDLTLNKPYYEPGQSLQGTVQADYFFGKHVAGATVELEARTRGIALAPLSRQTLQTDANGRATFTIPLPQDLVGRQPDAGDERVSLKATIRDSAGQEQSRLTSVVVTTSPIRIEVVPESGALVRDLPNRIFILTSYADGRPAKTSLAVTGLVNPPATNAQGVAAFDLTPKTDEVTLAIQAADSTGLRSTKSHTLRCGMPTGDFLVRVNKPVLSGGESLQVQTLGGGGEPVFLDLIKDGQTLLTRSIPMNAGKGDLTFDLPPDVFGTLELVAYRYLDDTGLPVRKQRVLYVRQANALRIATTLDKPQYRPGEPAKLTFQLTDAAGKPTPGALSLAGVDEAVFSVLQQPPGLEQTFFTLEQRLLKPVYAIYPWSPDLHRADADQRLLEQALFARTADQVSDRDAFLQRLVQQGTISPRSLRGLNNPYAARIFREQLDELGLSDEQKAMLADNATVHSLSESTGPDNAWRIARLRTQRLELMPLLWGGAIFASLLLVMIWLRGVAGGISAAILFAGFCALLIALLLPSLGRARELSSRSAAQANASGVVKAIVVAAEEGQLTPPPTADPAAPRLRQSFPETLLWRPELITDDAGRATLNLDLADSITTWRLTTSAVSADGRLGAAATPLRVFQPFFVDLNLPVALTRNDEVTVPVVVYNYLDQPQTVELALDLPANPWFTLVEAPPRSLPLAANEVRSVSFRLRATKVGFHPLKITARAADVADAIQRHVEVVPDGRRIEQVVNGSLTQPADIQLTLPPDAIEGSGKALVKVYPSTFSQLVEGLDGIFQQPYGCFEQTSSTTYPNVLALDYLQRTHKSVPHVEAAARQYIHLGYQRLVSFEVPGGGFDWFGRPPANPTLTAYGLLEFQDMARVHNVDPALITRTRKWLLQQRAADGSWSHQPGIFHDDLSGAGRGNATLATTAYIAWAVFNADPNAAEPTRNYLAANVGKAQDHPYVLATIANALLAIDPHDPTASACLTRLEQLKHVAPDGKTCWWTQSPDARTAFYGDGVSGNIETTAMVTLANLRANRNPTSVRNALTWLIAQKDARGTWHSTQATVLALKALITATDHPLGGDQPRTIALKIADTTQTLTITPDQADVLKLINLSPHLKTGTQTLTLTDPSAAATTYQVAFSYYLPEADPPQSEPLSITLDFDRTDLSVNQTLTATATLRNNLPAAAPMILVDLPIPPGFTIAPADLDKLRADGLIDKYQLTPRSAIIYLRGLAPSTPLKLTYKLTATTPARVTAPPATIYEYYKPENRSQSHSRLLTVRS